MDKKEQLIRDVMENMPEYNVSMYCQMWDYKECRFKFQDLDGDCKFYDIGLEELSKGYTIMRKKIKGGKLHLDGITLQDDSWFDAGNWDALAVDALVQCAIFGDVIYG